MIENRVEIHVQSLRNLHCVSELNRSEKMKIQDLNIQKELDLHLSRIRSTHEYYNLAQYEL